MLFMESYMFCASVRLAVIVISSAAWVKNILIFYVITTQGTHFLLPIISSFENNLNYRVSYYMVRDAIFWIEKYPDVVIVSIQLYCICHSVFCFFAAYGAYKLKRFFTVPLAILEFLYIVQIITIFILFLRIVRHFVDLGNLILLCLSATAYSFLAIYDLFALVAFEQIMALVRSKRYQQLYGSDPLNPIINHITKQQLKEHPTIVYVTPKTNANMPKWWQVESLEHNNKENIMLHDAHRYF